MKKCPGERLCEFVAAKFYVTWSLNLFGSVEERLLPSWLWHWRFGWHVCPRVPKFGEPMVLGSQWFLHAPRLTLRRIRCSSWIVLWKRLVIAWPSFITVSWWKKMSDSPVAGDEDLGGVFEHGTRGWSLFLFQIHSSWGGYNTSWGSTAATILASRLWQWTTWGLPAVQHLLWGEDQSRDLYWCVAAQWSQESRGQDELIWVSFASVGSMETIFSLMTMRGIILWLPNPDQIFVMSRLAAWVCPPWARTWIIFISVLGSPVVSCQLQRWPAAAFEVRAMTASYQVNLHAELLRAFDKAVFFCWKGHMMVEQYKCQK